MQKSREHQILTPLPALRDRLDIKIKHIDLPNDKRYIISFI